MKRKMKGMSTLLFEFAKLIDEGKAIKQDDGYYFVSWNICFTSEMFKFCGTELTVKHKKNINDMKLFKNTDYVFLDFWLEPEVEERTAVTEFKVGDKVKVKSREELLKILEGSGYSECSRGNWRKYGKETFYDEMFCMTEETFSIEKVYNDKSLRINDSTFEPEWVEKV